jgi:hypothetical protein
MILDKGESTLPDFVCIARFQSTAISPKATYSELVVCWFREDLNETISVMLSGVGDQINWEESAQDIISDLERD